MTSYKVQIGNLKNPKDLLEQVIEADSSLHAINKVLDEHHAKSLSKALDRDSWVSCIAYKTTTLKVGNDDDKATANEEAGKANEEGSQAESLRGEPSYEPGSTREE